MERSIILLFCPCTDTKQQKQQIKSSECKAADSAAIKRHQLVFRLICIIQKIEGNLAIQKEIGTKKKRNFFFLSENFRQRSTLSVRLRSAHLRCPFATFSSEHVKLFDAPLRRFLGRMGPASSAQDSASALRDGGPGAIVRSSQLCALHCIYHPLCPHRRSGRRRRAQAASFLHGVCSCDSTFSRFSFARRLQFRRCPDSV